ncbi:PREDICTED: elongation of very long chain fatty acids protein 4-like isoform X2 [Vollenhovia emeryi]|uniref:elongation of very long chain fatty acids protein 4-like isoform X2 n=1 Tax=Vollenhovia emeryi TaxID=411798 RepID=UPI0005F4CD1D|nr:PREDICTED: elongation of very long chain fatty acids protein 4-like isoform X2 [Vollenhovia emeryi]
MANFTKWLLFSSPTLVISTSLVYLYFVYFAGPQFMKNRKPYSLKQFIRCYNLFQIVANFLIVFNIMTKGRPFVALWKYCEPFDKICDRYTEKELEIICWGLVLKGIDFTETVIFVLRKKHRQISFLHTFHHVSTFIGLWLVVKYFAHSFLLTLIALNPSVHVIMYSYYFLSTFGSNMQQKLLPIKKWITIIQMIQIVFIMVVSSQGFIPNCGNMSVKYYSVFAFSSALMNLLLFYNFYSSHYKKSKNI